MRKIDLAMTPDTDEPARPQNHMDLVVVEQRSLTRRELPPLRSLSIGRDHDCDIVLRDPATSRRHALLRVAGEVSIEDLDSRNGTRLGGARLAAGRPTPLGLGDSVQIGGAILLLRPRRHRAPDWTSTLPRAPAPGIGQVVSTDPAMRAVYELIAKVAPSRLTILVLGETGVGKELIAEMIHSQSGARSANPLVRINCAALAPALLESELFGHERGSFTGALHAKPGLFEAADGGTAFLDEIGELPAALQAKLLRVLETREVTRVGGVRARHVDVRFVAATNRDLRADVARGGFRKDLYFRLAGATVRVPPLRHRIADMEPLVIHFVSALCSRMGREPRSFSEDAAARMRSYHWPGNVRELRNVVECALLRASGPTIGLRDLAPEWIASTAEGSAPSNLGSSPGEPPASGGAPADVRPSERDRILGALAACHGNQTRAAEKLRMPRRTFVRKLAVYGLPRPLASARH
jgi:two-component system, NtrC family, response regulator AtoC